MRHHGFPSPLLDWTASPYVAMFFAMDKVAKDVKTVSVYVYCETPEGNKTGSPNEPIIHHLGQNVRVHRRHLLQQSNYTYCTERNGDEWGYASHERVVSENQEDQDLLWKFNIPVTERIKVLRQLKKMNINAYSLFGTEDRLIDSIATDTFVL